MAKQTTLNWDKANDKAIEKALKELFAANEEKGVHAFGQILEEISKEARTTKDYEDQTANLKNSTGGLVVEGGKVTQKDFQKTKGNGKGRANGRQIGIKLANSVRDNKKNSVELIVVAGMEYAEKLESKGYKVLTFALPSILKLAKKLQSYYK